MGYIRAMARSLVRIVRAAPPLLAALLLLGGCMTRSDALAPIISIYEPKSGTTRSVAALQANGVHGYAMDDEGVAAIRVNGRDLMQDPSYASERGKRFVDFGFRPNNPAEGEITNVIEVEDVNGRRTTQVYTLRIDATPPTLELVEITPLGNGRLRVKGVARDNAIVTSVRVSGEPLQFPPAAEVSFEIDVSEGESGEVEVTDGAGNTTARQLR